VIQTLIDELVSHISKDEYRSDLARAKSVYFKNAGAGLFGDEESYDMRITAFLEWYIFDRSIGGKTVLDRYTEEITDSGKRAAFLGLAEGIRSVFQVKKVEKSSILFSSSGYWL